MFDESQATPFDHPPEPSNSQLNDPVFWKQIIQENWHSLTEDVANIENAALMMSNFCSGMNFVLERAKKLKLCPARFDYPSIALVIEKNRDAAFSYMPRENRVLIYASDLAKLSKLSMTYIVEAISAEGEVTFVGTIPNYFKLGGAEEMTHAIQHFADLLPLSTEDLSSLSGAEYLAQAHEKQALKWKINTARRSKMHNKTISNLVMQLAIARRMSEGAK